MPDARAPPSKERITIDPEFGGALAFALGKKGRPQVVFSQDGTGKSVYISCADETCSATTRNVLTTATAGVEWQSFVIDRAGNPRVVFYDSTDDNLGFVAPEYVPGK